MLSKLISAFAEEELEIVAIKPHGLIVKATLLTHADHIETAFREFCKASNGTFRAYVKPFARLPDIPTLERVAVPLKHFAWGGEPTIEDLVSLGSGVSTEELVPRIFHMALLTCRIMKNSTKLFVKSAEPGKVDLISARRNIFTWSIPTSGLNRRSGARKPTLIRLTHLMKAHPELFISIGYYPHLPPNHPEFVSSAVSLVTPRTLHIFSDDKFLWETARIREHLTGEWFEGDSDRLEEAVKQFRPQDHVAKTE